MSKATLQSVRMIVPGIILFVAMLPLLQSTTFGSTLIPSLGALEAVKYLLVVAPLGALYYASGLRWLALSKAKQEIDDNVKTRLLAPFCDEPQIAGFAQQLREGNTLLHLFFHIVDNDESLKEKAKDVYFNGAIWSSAGDLAVLAYPLALLYAGAFVVTWHTLLLVISFLMAGIGLIAFLWLLPALTSRQIALSNDQIDYVLLRCRQTLRNGLLEAAQALLG